MPKAIFDKKNILVTGGAGFIGSYLCEELLKTSKVICVDNFISGDQANINHLLQNPDFIFIKYDITYPLDLESIPELERFRLQFQGIQEIYHLACPTSAKNFEEQRVNTILANSDGVKNILDLAVKYKAKFLQASSSVVYGPRPEDNHKFPEEYIGSVNLLSPRACYDEGKRFAESMAITYQLVYGVEVKLARIFRTYGPRMKLFDGQMIPDFITNALDNKDLTIYGDENFVTSLCYVTDIVDGLMKLMEAPADIGPVNLGSDVDVRLTEVAQKIIQMTGSKSQIIFESPLLFMTSLGLPELTRAKEKLAWIPIMTLEKGLEQAVDYARATKGLLGMK